MRPLIATTLAGLFLVGLACGSGSEPPAPAPPPATAAPSGFDAVFADDDDHPRHRGDTAEPDGGDAPEDGDAPKREAASGDIEAASAIAAAPPATAPRPSADSQAPRPGPRAPSPAPADVGWRAIVAFHSASAGPPPAEWTAAVAELRAAAAPHGIQVVLAPPGADQVAVDGGTVDITAFRAARDAGFVFAAQGKQPVFHYWPPQRSTTAAAGEYYGVRL